jgi:membrane associated rhomboid family serine protease
MHLMTNNLLLIALGWLVLMEARLAWWQVGGIALLTSGLGTWLLGAATSTHIGASGIIFGYLGFLLVRSYQKRAIGTMLLFLLGLLLYVAPYLAPYLGLGSAQAGTSWETHVFGFIGGLVSAAIVPRHKHSLKLPIESGHR